MRPITTTLLIITFILSLIGCRDSSVSSLDLSDAEPNVSEPNIPEVNTPDANDPPLMDSTAPSGETFTVKGTVVYKNIEGGFFAIDGDDGKKYDPIALPQGFEKDGLKVKATVRLRKDAMSFRMYGAIVEVVNVVTQ